ncbi:MAG: hypothetical protein QXI19_01265 [Candidatus Caldarchaeum sp.]
MIRGLRSLLGALRARFSRVLAYSGKTVAVRRYFFSNSFDGVLAMMGLSLGASIVPGTQVSTVVFAGLGMSIAMLVSGVSGIYLTESAETQRMIKELRESMLTDVSDTVIGRAGALGNMITSFIGGISTFALSLVVLSPYMAAAIYKELAPVASYISTTIGLTILFVLGLLLGRFSRSSMVKSGLRMAALGVAAALLIMLVEIFVG